MSNIIKNILEELNPELTEVYPFICSKMAELSQKIPKKERLFDEQNSVLITYADQFQQEGRSPLQALNDFVEKDLEGVVSHVHILPFYPWTCDDGFGCVDYQKVEPSYGTWEDIENIKKAKMFDCVFNHLSSSSPFFQKALEGDEKCQAMFHIYSDEEYQSKEFQGNIKKVVRPRALPLFTAFQFNGEKKWVWTTFSEDQVDTNLNNKDMLHYLLESFFLYIEKGATFFRIDAVPFMWKELGTSCSHHRKTHLFVKLLRAIVDEFQAGLLIITESNVPHHENITYWGNGSDEAHVIYNFTLSPLLVHAMTFESSEYFSHWANGVFNTSPKTTYLNFTATHDGIGLRGVEGIVPEQDVQALCDIVEAKGGFVGKKTGRDGRVRPYELNITWANLMQDDDLNQDEFIKKVVHSQSLVMFFPGIGAHYVHNFLGTMNWLQGYEESGIPRRLNRKKMKYPIEYTDLSFALKNRMVNLIKKKEENPVFSPKANFEIVDLGEKVIAFHRWIEDKKTLVIFNLTKDKQEVKHNDGTIAIAAYDLIFLDVD